ncbi:MAG: CHRD domain-containing protein [Chloroflexia bacterium]|nr:CHRD domain-containing protein [Chloroflexia bacterium]
MVNEIDLEIDLVEINDQVFLAVLEGDNEVPPVETDAFGDAIFFINGEGELEFEIIVVDIDNVTAAHIHLGQPGENGPVVATLFTGAFSTTDPNVPETLVTGVITDEDLQGPLAGQTVEALLAQMEAGNTYTNVNTTEFPGGEIRGQNEFVNP